LADSIKGFIQPIFEGFKSAFDEIKKTIIENKDEFQSFFNLVKMAAPIIGNVIGTAFELIGKVAGIVLNVMANVVGALEGLINTAINLLNIAIRGFNILKPGNDIPFVSQIGSNTSAAGTGAIGNLQLSTGTTLGTSGIGATGGFTTGSTGGLTSGLTGGLTSTTLKKIGEDTKKTVTEVAGAFDQVASGTTTLAGIIAASNPAFAFGTSGVNTSTLAGINSASRGTTINLTVNGAIDSEGAARTIVNTLNDSYYRGTGGGSAVVSL
jgi:hypothetical protein